MKKFFSRLLSIILWIIFGIIFLYALKWNDEHFPNEKKDDGNWFMSPANPVSPIWYPPNQ